MFTVAYGTPEQVCTQPPIRSCPRIAAFIGEETIQHFVLLEQKVLCQVPSFQQALFIALMYVLHLEYPKQINPFPDEFEFHENN